MKLKLIIILLAVFIIALYLDTSEHIKGKNDIITWEEHLEERLKRKKAPTFKDLCFVNECYNHIFYDISVTKDTFDIPVEPRFIALTHNDKTVYGPLFSDLYYGNYTITAQNPFFETLTATKTLHEHELLEMDDLLSLFYTKEEDKNYSLLTTLAPFTAKDIIYIYHESFSEECYYDAVKIKTDYSGIIKAETYQKELNTPTSRDGNFFTSREQTVNNKFVKDLIELEQTLHKTTEIVEQKNTHKVIIIRNGVYKIYHIPKDLYFGLKINNIIKENTY